MDWLNDALCKKLSQDFFFPPLDAPSPNNYYAIGKYVCRGCKVWQDCLEYAEGNEEVWGLWGGLTPQERKRKANIPHGTMESNRAGCACDKCAATPSWDSYTPDLSLIPTSRELYELQPLLFNVSKGHQ